MTLQEAADAMTDILLHGADLALASNMTCAEALAIADVMVAAGRSGASVEWMSCHADGDDSEGDCSHAEWLHRRGA